ncbi:MAG: SagB/ThcOx family dehydrogenase [Anaerolineae bacterium]|nr:SagB/ThcOx family dehydrogenase [Anaerolineae bacterium]
MTNGIGREFMHKTQYQFLGTSDQHQGKPQPPLELAYEGDAIPITLPAPESIEIGKIDLTDAIRARRSVRRYADAPLALGELSYLLWATQGVRELGEHTTLRTVPSAGARHAFETYLLVNNVEGLAPGLYRYLALDHEIVRMDAGADIAEQVTAAALGQQFVKNDAATFIWTAVPYRMAWRYGERGYRYLHLDAGHVCQNLYLAVQAVGCGACAIAAFDDAALNAVLGIDGATQFAIYMATVGKKRE